MRRTMICVATLFILAMPLYAETADQPAQSGHGGSAGGGHQTMMCPMMQQMHGQEMYGGRQMMGGMREMMGERMGRSNPWFQHRISLILQNSAKLGLNDQQKAKLNEIHRKYARVIIRQKAELKIAEIDLDDLLKESEINMQKAKDTLKKIEGIEIEIGYQKIEALTEAKKVLTEEQRANLIKIMEAPAPAMGGEMGCMMCPMMGEGMTGGMMGQPAPAPQKEGEGAPAKDPHGH